jgi:Ca-activated chloride channel family protein
MRRVALGLMAVWCACCGARRYGPSPVMVQAAGGYASAQLASGEPVTEGEQYARLPANDFVDASADALATFSLDADTGSYALMRRDITRGSLPNPDGVRVEEYVNYFRYGDPLPAANRDPFAGTNESAPSHFGDGRHLLRVAVQGRTVPAEQRPSANLVFLVDVSGSMASADKLGLVQHALSVLVDSLRPDDTVGIVVYAGSEGVLLPPTPISQRGTILAAIDSLVAGGSTNGQAGLRAAYDLAAASFRRGGINRVILCTDGDFNVGLTGDELIRTIEARREQGITLSALGFGSGNYNDRDMEQLADRGNGSYAYIDSENEALRVLSRDLGGTLQVIAADVKVQIAFNPEVVRRFRLIGYENRVLAHEDFANDTVDAAEIGSGQFSVAYLEYELAEGVAHDDRVLAEVMLRYKQPGEDQSRLLQSDVRLRQIQPDFARASEAFRFGAAVAEVAELLRHSPHRSDARWGDILSVAQAAGGTRDADRREFLQLVQTARNLSGGVSIAAQ